MRVSVFILLILLVSCSAENKEDYRGYTKHTLQLVDSLGEIELMLPNYYDTLHSWVMFGSDKCYTARCYRYQPSNYKITQQKNGTFTDHDSVEHYLTISHDYYLSCCYPNDSLICRPLKHNTDTIIQFESYGRQFCYFSFTRHIESDERLPYATWHNGLFKYAKAYTYLSDLTVKFEFRTLNSDYNNEDFDQECLKILKSVKITGEGAKSLKRSKDFDPRNKSTPNMNRTF